ncbi:unnamed protein product [Moneuplotes crassus]|uniref:Protein kinase domain-containing protein n=1 Tax=Euplotes crassus TaxID=5936 RepID=A0AAD1UR91_EUPCR|nr:unnamed protein product [Moneuplotes crassus]
MRKKRMMLKKQLSVPLTDLLVKPEDAYDISTEYEIHSQLGFGTYSQVKSATRISDGSKVAIKISSGSSGVALLQKEKSLMESLTCPFFPQIFDFKLDKVWNKAYLIMEKIPGESLDSYIKNSDKIPVETIEAFINQLCAIIKYLHCNNICHRDLKPQNIIVTKDNTLRLLDFNISKKIKDSAKGTIMSEVFYTQISTPQYAAPEVYSTAGYTPAIDIWGIGIIGYLLCGGIVTTCDLTNSGEISQEKIIFKGHVESYHPLPRRLRTFLCSCLNEDPNLRPTVEDDYFNSDIVISILTASKSFEKIDEENKEDE